MRNWKLEGLANGKEISAVPFWMEKEDYLRRKSTISEQIFRKITVSFDFQPKILDTKLNVFCTQRLMKKRRNNCSITNHGKCQWQPTAASGERAWMQLWSAIGELMRLLIPFSQWEFFCFWRNRGKSLYSKDVYSASIFLCLNQLRSQVFCFAFASRSLAIPSAHLIME